MIEVDNFNRQLIYKNSVRAEDGSILHVAFVLDPHEIEIIHQWRQSENDKVDIDENISEYLTTKELKQYNDLDEKQQLEFITKAADLKRHFMDSDNIAWREATEMAIKEIKLQYL
jgi:hypothetical protein